MQSRRLSSTPIHLAALLISLLVNVAFGIQSSSFGPGVAGQIHALAFDADDPETIYVGGDTFGISRTTNLGDTWGFWNFGLENTHDGRSMYVEDLLSIGTEHTSSGYAGLFAATHGGIYYQAATSGEWELTTPPEDFVYGIVYGSAGIDKEDVVGFSSLAFDGDESVFAGAGHARFDWVGKNSEENIYTLTGERFRPHPDGPQEEYSLWINDLMDGPGGWQHLENTAGLGPVRQIDCFIEDGGTRHVAFATPSGVYDYRTSGGSSELVTLTSVDKLSPPPQYWSYNSWGVAFDSAGTLFVLNLRGDGDERHPGIYAIDVLGTGGFKLVGNLGGQFIIGTNTTTVFSDFITDTTVDLTTLSLRDNADGSTDLIVGNQEGSGTSNSNGGGFIHANITADQGYAANPTGEGYATVQWKNLMHYGVNWDDLRVNPVDTSPPVEASLSNEEKGWLVSEMPAITPTVEFGFSPHTSSTMLAWLYHLPLLQTSEANGWQQIYCNAVSSGWEGRGCNEMSVRSVDFLSDGRLVVGGLDWDVWLNLQPGGESFVNLLDGQSLDVLKVEIHDDDIYAIVGTDTGEYAGARAILARHDGSSWQELDAWRAFGAEVVGHEFQDIFVDEDGGVFAIAARMIQATDGEWVRDGWSTVLRGTPPADIDTEWTDWVKLFDFQPRDFSDLALIPGQQKLILCNRVKSALNVAGGIHCYDLAQNNGLAPVTWLQNSTPETPSDPLLMRAVSKATTLAVDRSGSVLYVGTTGDRFNPTSATLRAGSVLRLWGPFDDVPGQDRWEVLANETSDTYGIGTHPLHTAGHSWDWTSGGNPLETAQRMTGFNEILIHPDNPNVIYAAVDAGEMHPSNGVWMLDGDFWFQVIGASDIHAPNRAPACLALSGQEMIVGSEGQELFRADVGAVEPQPTLVHYADISPEVLQGGSGMAYVGQPYASLSFDFDANPLLDPDYDDEGQDLVVTIPGDYSHLFQHVGEVATGIPDYSDVTLSHAIDLRTHGYRGLAAADYDNDGWTDLFVSHANTPLLLHNRYGEVEQTSFDNVIDDFGLAGLVDESWTATWADFNRDGYPDLFVGRGLADQADPMGVGTLTGLPDVLLENRTWCGEGFVDVSNLLAQPAGEDFCTQSATWFDIDQDGWVDLFAWDPDRDGGDSHSRLWMNHGPAGFTEEFAGRFVQPSPANLNGVSVQYVNDDIYPDILTATADGVDFWAGLFVGAFSQTLPVLAGGGLDMAGVRIFDHDLDGGMDLLCLSRDPAGAAKLVSVMNNGSSTTSFMDITSWSGLSDAGPHFTAQSVDATTDGDLDLYLGKPSAGGDRFFLQNRSIATGSPDEPLSRWYGVRLVGDGGTNVSALGATVEFEFPGRTVRRTVSSSWGLGSDSQDVIKIGIGPVKALSTARIYWPDGTTQEFPPVLGEVVTVADDVAPAYTSNSFTAGYVSQPHGKLDLVFEWRSDNAVDIARTRIHLIDVNGGPCDVLPAVIGPSHSNADYTVTKDAQGYHHRFEYHGVCQPTCWYQATAECFTTAGTFVTDMREIRVRACIDDIYFQE